MKPDVVGIKIFAVSGFEGNGCICARTPESAYRDFAGYKLPFSRLKAAPAGLPGGDFDTIFKNLQQNFRIITHRVHPR
jgi:hypothetical protein